MFKFRCGCGARIFSPGDIISHFQFGGFWRGIVNLVNVRIEFR